MSVRATPESQISYDRHAAARSYADDSERGAGWVLLPERRLEPVVVGGAMASDSNGSGGRRFESVTQAWRSHPSAS